MAASWTAAWAVRPDGSSINEYRVHHSGSSVTVRTPEQIAGGGRWGREAYAAKFGATRREAIEKFQTQAEADIRAAMVELADAEARVARALALAAEEAS